MAFDTKGGLDMTTTTPTTGDLYVRAMESTRRFVDAVSRDQWTLPTPCTDWNVRQVANHLIGENLWARELFQGKTIAEVGSKLDGDLTGDAPARAYAASQEAATGAGTAPGAMQTICHLSFGDYSGSDYAAQLFLDLLIHGWDIAKATGQDTTLDPQLVDACLPFAADFTRQVRNAGANAYGEDLTASAADDPQTQLLALVGRRA